MAIRDGSAQFGAGANGALGNQYKLTWSSMQNHSINIGSTMLACLPVSSSHVFE
jgi:hypothetical protein